MSNRVRPPSRLFSIAFAMIGAAIAGALLTPAAHAAAQALSVLVTNTAENPVPATVVGTPSVSIAGTPSVIVAGTPSVAIATDGREPVQAAKVFVGSPDTLDCGQIYQVPAGKRLVVQYVGVEAFGLSPTNKVAVRLNASSEAAQLNIPITKAFGALHVASEQVPAVHDDRLARVRLLCRRPGQFGSACRCLLLRVPRRHSVINDID